MINIKGRSILDLSANELSNLVLHDPPPDTDDEPVETESGDEGEGENDQEVPN